MDSRWRGPSQSHVGARAFLMVLAALWAGCNSFAQSTRLENPPLLVTANDPAAIVAGDWNEDGHQDLAWIDHSTTSFLHVLLGDGTGHFTELAPLELPVGICPVGVNCAMASGKFTRSMHQDLLLPWVSSLGEGFIVLPGKGDGTFLAPITSTLPVNYNSPISMLGPIADLNGDGFLDFAIPGFTYLGINLFYGDGAGHFTFNQSIGDVYYPGEVFLADVNGDGHPDVVSADVEARAQTVYLNDGKGNFASPTQFPKGGIQCYASAEADMNGDGKPDFLCEGQTGVSVVLSNGDGTFQDPQPIATLTNGGVAFAAPDLNGDGIPDVLVSDPSGVLTILSKATLSYAAPQSRTSGIGSTGPFRSPAFAIADFNGDGLPDLAVPVSGGIEFLYSNESGNYSDPTITPASDPVTYLFAGDFNSDGVSDVVAIDSSLQIETFLGSKSGVFGPPVKSAAALISGGPWISNAVGDFDGDGRLDIFLPGSTDQVLYGNGEGGFTQVTPPNTRLYYGLIADMNKDGRSDIVGLGNSGLTTLLGNGSRGFSTVVTSFPANPPGAGVVTATLLGLGDLNSDGWPDAVVLNPDSYRLEVWLGVGDGTFRPGSTVDLSTATYAALNLGYTSGNIEGLVTDIDGDGKLDLLFLARTNSVSSSQGVLVIEYGDGAGNFSQTHEVTLTHAFSHLAMATLDPNGRLGIVLGSDTLVSTIRNLGGRQYAPEEFSSAGTFTGLATADFNGDGLSDVLIKRSEFGIAPIPSSDEFTVLFNQATSAGSDSGQVSGSVVVSPSTVAFNGSFSVTISLQPPSVAGAPVPTGAVSLSVAGLHIGSATLVDGAATVQVPSSITQTLSYGENSVQAVYSGDAYYQSADLTAALIVQPPDYSTQTALTLTRSGAPVSTIQASQIVTFNVSVSAPLKVPGGYVAFYDGATLLGQTTLNTGTAAFGTNLLAIGNHAITAKYLGYSTSGSASYQSSSSSAVSLTVTAVSTAVTLSSSAASITSGSVLTLTATVTSASGTPSGGVTFFDGSSALGTLSLDSSGTAAFSTVSLGTGQHSLTAQFAANGLWAGSVSTASRVTANLAPASLTPTSIMIVAVKPAVAAGSAEFDVQLIGPSSSAGTKRGVISIIVDGGIVATEAVQSNDTATLTAPLSSGDMHHVYAAFSGTEFSAPSASHLFESTSYTGNADFTVQTADSQTAGVATPALSIPLTVRALGNWNSAVTFRCAFGVPDGYACAFAPSTVSGSGTTVLKLVPIVASSVEVLKLSILFVPVLLLAGRRRRAFFFLSIVGVALIGLVLSSCSAAAKQSTSVVTVEVAGGSIVHSMQIAFKTR